MAKHSIVVKIADGSTNQFSISFTGGFMSRDHVTARVDNEVDGLGDPSYRPITWITDGIVQIGGDLPTLGQEVEFRRTTPIDTPVNDFQNGAVLLDRALDEGFEQAIKRLQEVEDTAGELQLAEGIADEARLARDEAEAALTSTEVTLDLAIAQAAASASSATAAGISAAEAAASAAVSTNLGKASVTGFSPVDFLASVNPETAMERFTLTRQGSGAGNVMQGVCEVHSRDALYSLNVVGDPDFAVINKFDLNGDRVQTSSRHTKVTSNIVGHQGFAAEYTPTDVRFWSSANEAYPDAENHIVRFSITDDNADVENLLIGDAEHYRVFPGNDGAGNATPTISPDGNILVVELRLTDNTNRIRVFYLRDLVAGGPGDYSTGYHIAEFDTDAAITGTDHPLQSLATDGAYIYVLTGYGDPLIGKRLAKFNLLGDLIGYVDDFQVGRSAALSDGAGNYYEPEGMYVTKHAGSYVLAVCIASGDLGSRVNRVWYTNGDFQVAARGYHGKASFHSTGSNDFSVPDGEVLRMGGETDAGNFEERVAFGTNGTNSFGPRNSGTWTATIEDNVVRGAGNVSPTTAVGTFERIGNIVVISMSISNIDITGLAVGNAYIHGVALSPAPADSNFTLSAVVDSPIAVVYSDINRTDGTLEMNAMVDSDGYITLREARDDATNLILDTDRLDGADIRMNGVFITA